MHGKQKEINLPLGLNKGFDLNFPKGYYERHLKAKEYNSRNIVMIKTTKMRILVNTSGYNNLLLFLCKKIKINKKN